MSFDPLEADYPEAILRAIDGDTGARARLEQDPPDAPTHHRRSARMAGVALATAAVVGTTRALDDDGEADSAIEIIVEAPKPDPSRAVEVIFVPQDPRASVAIVRRWLLPSALQ